MKYKIVGDHVTYGGPKNYGHDITYRKNLSLSQAIDYIRENTNHADVDIEKVYSQKSTPENMGCYKRFEIVKDTSTSTLWENMTDAERFDLFDYAESWMDNEMAQPPKLLDKIRGFNKD